VQRFLAEHPDLPPDLRLKILQSVDELERTVRIKKLFGPSAQRSSDSAPLPVGPDVRSLNILRS
jgi:hypothetical protein